MTPYVYVLIEHYYEQSKVLAVYSSRGAAQDFIDTTSPNSEFQFEILEKTLDQNP